MIQTLKLRKIGNSVGVTFSKELLEKLNLSEGDTVFVTETEHGLQLSPYDPEFEKAMDIYRQGSQKFRQGLKELAKSETPRREVFGE
ncbi:MAG: AbrB/MazE/SpoVT family DNA-binding domain-containing protein [Dolichospermum sp. DEX189]|jgi:putative addiction module antidote|uniref:AbrB/MazE/SpoVT family DNA-binding domain-containing protein n=1 Tax=Dolichospermum sp. UHCC 0259 TaxID=2590010 RepID=UPI001446C7C3|nr:AbrB/MazE/SpoVT family DNA-binding domain-containing protein [Dolichospermum sp. UHCC 0259]MBO1070729.1 AbrB/MazE/SpoVT family DNA-binding domain-containing protein [Dolichospermum sp. DEX189]MDK2412161.1 AbrB/MazE/SpoVT family DNA-binding domain-containing protein [Aphanizomenon sp. 202]MDK2462493.1 AbrB/MazE/SpoVT family DNA-binding domain-containing protein [Aphanizomenon sp. PH219]MTJ46826.1 AbrB/MazE/SpoVT family DNA-binding domain-containing protein [Dolichospermum sp. UHCC 0259]